MNRGGSEMSFLQHTGRAFDPRIEKKDRWKLIHFACHLSLVGARVMSRETRNLRISTTYMSASGGSVCGGPSETMG
jgi:hypothetical protein